MASFYIISYGVLICSLCPPIFEPISTLARTWRGLINPLARRPGLVISTFGLAEIISCMPDGLVKKICIGY